MKNFTKIKQFVNALESIAEGQRNNTLYKLGHALKSEHGLTGKELLTALSKINQTKCTPPLPSSEVSDVAKSVSGADKSNGDTILGHRGKVPRKPKTPKQQNESYVTHGANPVPVAEIRGKDVSIYQNCYANVPIKTATIEAILNTFRTGGKSKERILAIRNESDKEQRDALKKELPAVVFNSEPQEQRKKDKCMPNGILCLDFDNIPADELETAKEAIAAVPYVFAVGLSVSRKGYFALAHYEGTPDLKNLLASMQADFRYPLDTACSDISRLRIVSLDPDIIIKDEVYPAILSARIAEIPEGEPAIPTDITLTGVGTVPEKFGIDVLNSFLEQIEPVPFSEFVEEGKPKHSTYYISSIDDLLRTAKEHQWDIGIKNETPYFYTGEYWKRIELDQFKRFLQAAGIKQGIPYGIIKDHLFVDKLVKQFACEARCLVLSSNNTPKIGLRNCTLHFMSGGVEQKPFDKQDGLTYQLNYDFDPSATAPIFSGFIDRVLPDEGLQKVIFQYIGYVFLPGLNLEKLLFLYGGGSNGKSVLLNIIRGLVGNDQCCEFSLAGLTGSGTADYQRAELGNYLLNVCTEISTRMGTDVFKKLASREPLSARLPYVRPFMVRDYATSVFAMNELPRDVEQTAAFFRRFMIIPFDVRIPEDEQDPDLARKILDSEMSGILNLVIEGVQSLLEMGKFDIPDAVRNAVNSFQQDSDSVLTFLTENDYVSDLGYYISLHDMHADYKKQCSSHGHHPVAIRKFAQRLRNLGYEVKKYGRTNQTVVFAIREHERLIDSEVPY